MLLPVRAATSSSRCLDLKHRSVPSFSPLALRVCGRIASLPTTSIIRNATFFVRPSQAVSPSLKSVCILKPSKRLHIPTQVQPDMVVRISDSGVAYKEIVNWCARSTFYSEKAAWKEFDRRTTGSLHVTGEREHGQKKVDS